jgi:hypothetical protein
MKLLALVAGFQLCVGTVAMSADSKAVGDASVDIFNGHDLAGWTIMNDAKFSVTNGVIHLEACNGWLRSDKQYTNFVFEMEWRPLQTNYNSGVFVRAGLEGSPFPNDAWQINLKEAALASILKGARMMQPGPAQVKPPSPNQWMRYQITVQGSSLKVRIDGKPAGEYEGLDAASGYVGVQAEGAAMEFRNVRIRILP